MKKISIACVFFMLMLSCSAQPKDNFSQGYNLSKPSAFYTLPDTLYEISGLTDVDSIHIGCVQDEKGMVFLYNLLDARIDDKFTFHLDGDYEGITRVQNDMYVLRSDGNLFRIKDFMLGHSAVKDSFATGIPITNNEGLCYDEINHRMLIAAKGKLRASKETRELRFIYGFDLDSMKTLNEPVLVSDINDVAKFMVNKGINVPSVTKKNGTVRYETLKFLPSSIAVHPKTDLLYVLSAVDHLLVIFNRNAVIVDVVELDATMFRKPEGITFMPSGDMLIANEGNGGKANLLRFSYHGK